MANDIKGKKPPALPVDGNGRAVAGIVLPIVDGSGHIVGWSPIATSDQGDGTLAIKVDTDIIIDDPTIILGNVKVGSTDQTSANTRWLKVDTDGVVSVTNPNLDSPLSLVATEATLAAAKLDLDEIAGTILSTGYGDSLVVRQSKDSIGLLGQTRVAISRNLFTSYFIYDKLPLLWDESTATGGTSTHDATTASVLLAVTATSGSSVIRQSREYIHYEPGKANQILLTGTFGAGIANCVQRIGLFDTNNGFFFELNGTTLNVVRRSHVSGSTVDTATAQTSWNLDKLDGTGVSGETLDITKSQLMVIEYLWLGVGPIRYGFYINGRVVYCHQIENSNVMTGAYAATGSLPVRYEISNTAGTSGATTLRQICCAVGSETENVTIGTRRSANTGATAKAVASGSPANQPAALLTIRLKSGFNRATVIPRHFSIISTTADSLFYQIILNGTIGGTPSYTSVGTDSAVEFDVAGTTVTGGTVVASGYISNQGREFEEDISSRVRLVANLAGTADTLSLVVGAIGAGGFLRLWRYRLAGVFLI